MTMSANECPSESNSPIDEVRFFANTVWVNDVDPFRLANQKLWITTKRLDRWCHEIGRSTPQTVNIGREGLFGSEETKCHQLFVQDNSSGPWLLPEVEEALRRFTFEVGTKHDSIWANKVETTSSVLFDREDYSSRQNAKTRSLNVQNGQDRSSTKFPADLSDTEDDLEEHNLCTEISYEIITPEDRELQRRITSDKVKRIWHNSKATGAHSSSTPLGLFDSHLNPTTLNANVPEFCPNSSNSSTTPEDVRRSFVFPSSLKDSYQELLFPYKQDTTTPKSSADSPFQPSLRDTSNYLPIPLPPTNPSGEQNKTSPKDDSFRRTSTLRSELSFSARSTQSADTRSITTKNVTNWRVSTSTHGSPSPQGCTSGFWSSFSRHNKTNSTVSNKFKRESYASLSARSSICRSSSPSKDSGFFQASSNVFRSSGVKLLEDPTHQLNALQLKPESVQCSHQFGYGTKTPSNSPRSNSAVQESQMLLSTSRSCSSTNEVPGHWEECSFPSEQTFQQNIRSSAPPSLFSVPVRPPGCCTCPMIPPPLMSRPGVYPRNIPVYQRPMEFYLTPDVMLHAEKKHQARGADHSNLIVLTGANKRHYHHPVNTKATFAMLNDMSLVAIEKNFPPLIMDPEPNPPGVDEDDEYLQSLNGNHDQDFKQQMDWLKKYYSSRIDWFTHASLLSDELALIEEQTVMEALEDMERDCNVAFPPIGNAMKRSPQRKTQVIGLSSSQANASSETSLELTPLADWRKEVVFSVQTKLSYKDVLANPAPLKSGESFHELEKLTTEELNPWNDSFQLPKSPDDSCVANPKYQVSNTTRKRKTGKDKVKKAKMLKGL